MRPSVYLATALTMAQAAYVVLMLVATGGKILEFGFLDFVQHFTNWSWLLQTLFYLATLPAPLIVALGTEGWALDLMAGFIALTFVPLWGIVSTVLLLVVAALATGSDLLDSFATVVPISVIVLGNEIYHFFTVLILLFWALANQRLLYYSLNQLFAHKQVHRVRRLYWAVIAYETLIGPLIPLLFYVSIFDWQVVYQTDTNFFLATLLGVLALIIATSPIHLFLHAFFMGSSPLYPRWMRESEFEATDDRLSVSYARMLK